MGKWLRVLGLCLCWSLAGGGPALAAGPNTPRPAWGLGFDIPPNWKSAEREGLLLLGSDTEPGLMILRYVPRTTRDELLASYRQGLQEAELVAQPVVEAQPFEVPGASGLAGVLEGQAQDGTLLRVRSIAVLSRQGGALVLLALTTPQQFARLQARADALARSVVFSAAAPALGAGGGGGGGGAIAGDYQYLYTASGGGYSREARLTLCASGRFRAGGEMSGSGPAGSAYTAGGQGGRWQASGDAAAGTLLLQADGGGTRSLPYRVSTNPRDRSGWGPALYLGNELYQKVGEGRC